MSKNMNNLRRARLNKNWTQVELSKRSGIKQPDISKAERYVIASERTLQKLAIALEYDGSPSSMLEGAVRPWN